VSYLYAPKDGWVANPILRLRRNIPCPCGSEKKFKKCCGPTTARWIKKEDLKEYEKAYELAREGKVAW